MGINNFANVCSSTWKAHKSIVLWQSFNEWLSCFCKPSDTLLANLDCIEPNIAAYQRCKKLSEDKVQGVRDGQTTSYVWRRQKTKIQIQLHRAQIRRQLHPQIQIQMNDLRASCGHPARPAHWEQRVQSLRPFQRKPGSVRTTIRGMTRNLLNCKS